MDLLKGKWLAAVSGGADSMALLYMCIEKGIDIAVAHVNYHHRLQSEEEEQYVSSFCDEHQIVCHILNEPFVYSGNFEAAARNWRYDFFVRLVKKFDYEGVLIAHQEDDLIETYLMQSEKGLVPAYYGLKEEMMYHGILVKRPLLNETAASLRQYCFHHGIRYYVDETNSQMEYTRNRIRHETVAPMSSFERKMVRQEIMKENAILQERRCRVAVVIQNDKISLLQYRYLNLAERDALLRMFLEKHTSKSLSLKFLRQIDEILMKKNDFMIPFYEKYIVADDGFFKLYEEKETYCDVYESLEEIRLAKPSMYYAFNKAEPGVNAVTVSPEDFPLTIRNFEQGDYIAMRYGTKQVHRFFIDRHIPLYLRNRWPVVLNAQGVVILVPGLGCDCTHYSIKPDFNVVQYNS